MVEESMNRVLMIAFHYPPIRGSSGVQRTLCFSRDLLEFGWQPTILTVSSNAFELTSPDQVNEIPESVDVHRALTLDAGRYLTVGGRGPNFALLPDRWASWFWSGIWLASRICKNTQFDAVWSTYPIATAHRIGNQVAKKFGIPWIADFRDGMYDSWFPGDKPRRNWHKKIERESVQRAKKVVLTTDGTREMYANRYSSDAKEKFVCIANGYDERIFGEIERSRIRRRRASSRIQILHSGILYTLERNPAQLFSAIANLRERGLIDASDLEIVFRGSRHESQYEGDIERLGIEGIVRFRPGIGFREAIQEMFDADGLLLLQGRSCNQQIPAKVYEYMRVRKPLLALTDREGDTARLLGSVNYGKTVAIDDVTEIERGLIDFVGQIRNRTAALPDPEATKRFDRKYASEQLARLLDEVHDQHMSESCA